MPTTPNINAEKIQGNLSLTSISATTYYNLPTDIRVTGGTYSGGTAIFTNNTGGTFTITGLTSVNGNSPQVGYFSSGTNLTGNNNFVYSGGSLQIKTTGSTSSDIPFKVRNVTDSANLFKIAGNGNFTLGQDTTYSLTFDPTSPSLRGRGSDGSTVTWQLSQWTNENTWITNNNTNQVLVGIGTTSPSDKLHIHTSVNDTSVKISTAAATPSDESAVLKFATTWAGSSFGGDAATIRARTKGTNTLTSQRSSLEFSLNSGGTTSIRGSITSQSNLLLQSPTEDTKDVGVIYIPSGSAPLSGITDGIKIYSSDITAGKAAPHFRTEDGDIVKLYTHSAVTTTQGIANALTTLGLLSASTITPNTDVFVTGGTYSSGTATFTNNTGGTFSVTGFTAGGGATFTGGTVTGPTNFTNTLSANTFIATSVTATTFDTVSFTSDTINIAVTPTNNNANTQVLTRNSSTGDVQYKDTSSFMTTGKIIALTQITYF